MAKPAGILHGPLLLLQASSGATTVQCTGGRITKGSPTAGLPRSRRPTKELATERSSKGEDRHIETIWPSSQHDGDQDCIYPL